MLKKFLCWLRGHKYARFVLPAKSDCYHTVFFFCLECSKQRTINLLKDDSREHSSDAL